jgi:hypothetical protein
VERGVWQDAKRGMLGQGWPVLPTLGAVPERGNAAKRSNSRRLARRVSEANQVERSETRMSGALSLWLLSLLREQRESNSPRGEINSKCDRCAAVNRGLPPIVLSPIVLCIAHGADLHLELHQFQHVIADQFQNLCFIEALKIPAYPEDLILISFGPALGMRSAKMLLGFLYQGFVHIAEVDTNRGFKHFMLAVEVNHYISPSSPVTGGIT